MYDRKDTSSVHGASSAPASSISSSTTRAAGAIAPCSEGNTHVQEAIHEVGQSDEVGTVASASPTDVWPKWHTDE